MQITKAKQGKAQSHRNPKKTRNIYCGHFEGLKIIGKKKSFKRFINNEFSLSIPGPI